MIQAPKRRQKIRVNAEFFSADYAGMAKLYLFLLFQALAGRRKAPMWYVIQTETGREEEVLSLMRQLLDKRLCSRYMILEAEWPKRSGGQWLLLRKAMFPGYIFVETEEAEEVFFQLKQIPKLTKILGNEKFEFVPLAEEEIQFLYQISKTAEKNGTEQRLLVHPSRITVDKAGTIDVISGPLKEFEKEILRVNLHKRYAVVKVKMLGEKTVLFGIVMEKDGERNS